MVSLPIPVSEADGVEFISRNSSFPNVASPASQSPRQCEAGFGLRALLFSVFDQDKGQVIECADPPNAVGSHGFKHLAKYLLPDSFARGRVVSVYLDDHVVVGAPVYIEDTRYHRNIFQFNICMVVSSQVNLDPYREIAQHLAAGFRVLEMETKLLSSKDKLEKVQTTLHQLRSQLNRSDECCVLVDASHLIAFRVRRYSLALAPPPSVDVVPVPLVDLVQLFSRPDFDGIQPADETWTSKIDPDASLLQLLPYVDGIRSIASVADASGVDLDATVACLRHLQHFGFVAFIDAIGLDKRYRLTNEFHRAFERPDVASEVVRYVTAGVIEDSPALMQEIRSLYCSVDGWSATLDQFKQMHMPLFQQHGFSLRHFITFGLMKGFLKPVYRYTEAHRSEIERMNELRAAISEQKAYLKTQGLSGKEINQNPKVTKNVKELLGLKEKMI
eukprot:TRINITY_DN15083_c5_g1_i1.p1 TRINITY_DN15083_c5_g1~~TRINITY_DN15083_c5_g1_i1.p1  ORF type:complete len:445 (+),score=75.43 TRINITY_DN15083_c5_g1_i1:253-1587(+)